MARTDTRTHARRLRRGQRWWDLVSPIHGSAGGSTTQVAELALQYLDLKEGQTVLDLGCGSGAALPTLREAVGPLGRVVGIDYSPRMLARAEAVIRERGFENVELRVLTSSCEGSVVTVQHERLQQVAASFRVAAQPGQNPPSLLLGAARIAVVLVPPCAIRNQMAVVGTS